MQVVKNLAANAGDVKEMEVWSLGQEDPMEEEMATHSSILSWRIPWTEEPGKRPSIHTHTRETSLVVKWLRLHASKAGDVGSIPSWGSKIPHAMLWNQKKQNKTKQCQVCPGYRDYPMSPDHFTGELLKMQDQTEKAKCPMFTLNVF